MPTLLFPTDRSYLTSDNEKSLAATTITLTDELRTRRNLEQQLKQGSLRAAVELSLMTGYKHDVTTDCYHCDKLAKYYLAAFRFSRSAQPIACNLTLLQLVQLATELIHSHMDIGRMQHLPWLPMIMDELRELCKQIKEESRESDRIVPLPLPTETDEEEEDEDEEEDGEVEREDYSAGQYLSASENYARAIRISIYHCRASFCEDMDTNKAITYYRKCLFVRSPTVSEAKKLQRSAKAALRHLIADQYNKYAQTTIAAETRPSLPSRTSSVSSGASSSSSMSCSNCGVEKRGMPVCSKCKSTYYCTVRCLKAHKAVHDLECNH